MLVGVREGRIVGYGPVDKWNHEVCEVYEVPEQDLSHLHRPDPADPENPGAFLLVGVWPDDIPHHYTVEEIQALAHHRIDLSTGERINSQIHIEEQIGRLRYALAYLYDQRGIDEPPELTEFNEISAVEILKGQAEKEALDA
jgi:hypothetical protein